LTEDGTIECWGRNAAGQVGDGTKIGRSAPASVALVNDAKFVGVGNSHACAVRTLNGDTVCWGSNQWGQLGLEAVTESLEPAIVPGVSGVVALDAGGGASVGNLGSTCGVTQDGGVVCWGGNAQGQLGVGDTSDFGAPTVVPGISGAVDISVGATHVCALMAAGPPMCWGANAYGQLGDGSTTRRTSPVAVARLVAD
jgi:alpha-tubulin suppressor-like RCC1 family protein